MLQKEREIDSSLRSSPFYNTCSATNSLRASSFICIRQSTLLICQSPMDSSLDHYVSKKLLSVWNYQMLSFPAFRISFYFKYVTMLLFSQYLGYTTLTEIYLQYMLKINYTAKTEIEAQYYRLRQKVKYGIKDFAEICSFLKLSVCIVLFYTYYQLMKYTISGMLDLLFMFFICFWKYMCTNFQIQL